MKDYLPTKKELQNRVSYFIKIMDENHPGWGVAIIVSKVNQYYFLGTMQDAVLFIKSTGDMFYFVRKSYWRAQKESPLFDSIFIKEYNSYRDAAAVLGRELGDVFIESEIMTQALYQRLAKHFDFSRTFSMDKVLLAQRAVKSDYELGLMEESGRRHNRLLTEIVPGLLKEGISEAELAGKLYAEMIKLGHQGVSRFMMFQTEMGIGHVTFGESSLYPTSFDGPGGAYGMSPAVPLVGSPTRLLKRGDLVFVDIAFGFYGYHTDKTQVYVFGDTPTADTVSAHRCCIEIQAKVAEMLKPDFTPTQVYTQVTKTLTKEEKDLLGGFEDSKVKFLGHGIGLYVDEYPVIAQGFDNPLQNNMVLAVEPKMGLAGIGMVGVEETYVVTPTGGRCITGGSRDIIIV